MNMIINSMYTNREVFLRELLANASDALDKFRLLSLQDGTLLDSKSDGYIRVAADKEKNTLTIEDNGIGMNEQDLTDYLGTLANSGTKKFMKKLEESKDNKLDASNLIGQFGVGFYSCFLVADKVQVVTSKGDKEWMWESEADAHSFTISETTTSEKPKRGTKVILHLKDDAKVFLDDSKLEELMKKYSQFFSNPIYHYKMVEEEEEEDKEEEKDDENDGDEEKEKKEVEKDEKDAEKSEKKKKEKKEKKLVQKDVWMNPNKPIWLRKPEDVSREEYVAFYKAYFNDHSEPLDWVHFKGEGDVNFWVLLYIPKRPAFSAFSAKSEREEKTRTMAIYVRRVFVKWEQLFTEAMSPFCTGIIDSDELPLNVSREVVQNSALFEQIGRKTVNKVLDRLAYLAENDKKAFESFYSAFSQNIKLEIIQNATHRKRLARLLQYPTSKHTTEQRTLKQYIEGIEEGQPKNIYFLSGHNVEDLMKSPLVEGFISEGTEVLLATESLDEYCLQSLGKYDDYEFKNVAKEKATSSNVSDTIKSNFSDLCEWLKSVLSAEVSDVVLSSRLKNSSCAVAVGEFGMSGHMESVLRAQAGASNDPMLKFMEMQKRIFEINPNHPIISSMNEAVKRGKKEETKDIATTLYNAALIRSGFAVKNSQSFMNNLENLITSSLNAGIEAARKKTDGVNDEQTEKRQPEKINDKAEQETQKAASGGEVFEETHDDL